MYTYSYLHVHTRGRVRMSPADEVAVEELPERELTSDDIRSLPSNQRNCVVCLQNYAPGDSITILPCLHRFHTACIER